MLREPPLLDHLKHRFVDQIIPNVSLLINSHKPLKIEYYYTF